MRGLDIARFSTWAVGVLQPIVDELGIDYDVASTTLYIGGGTSHSPAFQVIQLETPGSDVGASFGRTARSVLHELGHQLEYAIDGYSSGYATWKSENMRFGDDAYFIRGTVEWQADQFANEFLPTVVGQ